jgi:hypothetical protein
MVIKFSKAFTPEKAPLFIQAMQKRYFSLYNTVLKEGSVLVDSMVIDERKQVLLAINVNSDRIVLIPHSPDCFDSVIRFYQSVVETVDRGAACLYLPT